MNWRAGRLGEYQHPRSAIPKTSNDFGNEMIEARRTAFLDAMFKIEPQTMETLAPLLLNCPSGHYRDIHKPRFAGVRANVKTWARAWHLNDRWCENIALQLLLHLRYKVATEHPEVAQADGITWTWTGPAPNAPERILSPAFSFLILPGWDVLSLTRADFEVEARAGFEKALKQYCECREAEARKRGLEKAPEKKRTLEHYNWLVRYQVKGESFATIFHTLPQGQKRTRRAVEKAIHVVAAEIELTLRR